MQFGVDLFRIRPDDWPRQGPPDAMPEYTQEVWIYRHPGGHPLGSIILLERQDDGAYRIGVAEVAIVDGGLDERLLCEQRLDPPDPSARTPDGDELPFGTPAALAWAVLWIAAWAAP